MAEPFAAPRPLAGLLCASLIWLSPVCVAQPTAEPASAHALPAAASAPEAEHPAPAAKAREPLNFRPTRLQLCQRELGDGASSQELTTCLSRRMRAETQAERQCRREANQIKGSTPQQTTQLRQATLSQCLDTALMQPFAQLRVAPPAPTRSAAPTPRPPVTAADSSSVAPRPGGMTETRATPAEDNPPARPVPASSSKNQTSPSGQVATAAPPPPSKRAVSNEAAAPRTPSRTPSVALKADPPAEPPSAKAPTRKAAPEGGDTASPATRKAEKRGDSERGAASGARAAPADAPKPAEGQTARAAETAEPPRPSKRAVTRSAEPRAESRPTSGKGAETRQTAAQDVAANNASRTRTQKPSEN